MALIYLIRNESSRVTGIWYRYFLLHLNGIITLREEAGTTSLGTPYLGISGTELFTFKCFHQVV